MTLTITSKYLLIFELTYNLQACVLISFSYYESDSDSDYSDY